MYLHVCVCITNWQAFWKTIVHAFVCVCVSLYRTSVWATGCLRKDHVGEQQWSDSALCIQHSPIWKRLPAVLLNQPTPRYHTLAFSASWDCHNLLIYFITILRNPQLMFHNENLLSCDFTGLQQCPEKFNPSIASQMSSLLESLVLFITKPGQKCPAFTWRDLNGVANGQTKQTKHMFVCLDVWIPVFNLHDSKACRQKNVQKISAIVWAMDRASEVKSSAAKKKHSLRWHKEKPWEELDSERNPSASGKQQIVWL